MDEDTVYEMVDNAAYVTAKRDLSTNSSTDALRSGSNESNMNSKKDASKRNISVLSLVLIVVTCINILLALISLVVAVFAAVNLKALQSQMNVDGSRNSGTQPMNSNQVTADSDTMLTSVIQNVTDTQSRVSLLTDDVRGIVAMQSSISEMIVDINRTIGSSAGPPGQ